MNEANIMGETRRMTSRGLSVLPLLLMGVTHLSLPPLKSMFDLEPRLMYGYYGLALLLGVVLLRRSGVVKDHEYNRAKAMKKIRHVYEAEARGVWETNASLNGNMDPKTQGNLSKTVGEFSAEGGELELPDDEQVEVRMLSEAAHVVKANARVSGEISLDGDTRAATVGATRNVGPMDRFLDALFGLFGRDSRAEREAQRRRRLEQAASYAPVVAQRPVAPLRFNKTDDASEVNMVSMSDEGGVETVISSTGMEKEVPLLGGSEVQPNPMQESLESMAMMGQVPSSSNTFSTAGPQCRGCGSPVSSTERFCPHCGLDL